MPRELSDDQMMGPGAGVGKITVPQIQKLVDDAADDGADPVEGAVAEGAVVDDVAGLSVQQADGGRVAANQSQQAQVSDKKPDEIALEALNALFADQPLVPQHGQAAPAAQTQTALQDPLQLQATSIEISDEEFEKLTQNKAAFLSFMRRAQSESTVEIMKRVLPVIQQDMQQQMFAQRVSSEFYNMFPALRSKGREVTAEINKIRMLQPELPMQAVLVQTAKNLGALNSAQQAAPQTPRKAPARTASARSTAPATPETDKARKIRSVVFSKGV